MLTLKGMLENLLPDYRVRFLEYRPWRRFAYEILRACKPNRKIPFHNLIRYRRLMSFERRNLDIDPVRWGSYAHMVRDLDGRNYDVLAVAKVIWDFSNMANLQRFPNLFWLSDKIAARKIAIAVSGHRTDMRIFRRHKSRVRRLLGSYSAIGVRDDLTMEMMVESGVDQVVPVRQMPDPAFFYDLPKKIDHRGLKKFGILPDRPVMGLLLHGKPLFSNMISRYYRSRGYQVISFGIYNPYADINLGHRVDPVEWAALFQQLDFCVTDRFHCTVFCIRNLVPFVSIEPFAPLGLSQSKIYDLLKKFGLTDCYTNTYDPSFDMGSFIEKCAVMESEWLKMFEDRIRRKLDDFSVEMRDFLNIIKNII